MYYIASERSLVPTTWRTRTSKRRFASAGPSIVLNIVAIAVAFVLPLVAVGSVSVITIAGLVLPFVRLRRHGRRSCANRSPPDRRRRLDARGLTPEGSSSTVSPSSGSRRRRVGRRPRSRAWTPASRPGLPTTDDDHACVREPRDVLRSGIEAPQPEVNRHRSWGRPVAGTVDRDHLVRVQCRSRPVRRRAPAWCRPLGPAARSIEDEPQRCAGALARRAWSRGMGSQRPYSVKRADRAHRPRARDAS